MRSDCRRADAGRPSGARCASRPAAGLAIAAALLLAQAGAAPAQTNAAPKEAQNIAIDQRLNAHLPLDAVFFDESGNQVALQEYFHSGKPVVLTLNYFRCPMLCGVQLQGLLDTLKRLEWTPGQQFEIVTVSFDPGEKAALARAKKQSYIADFGRPDAAAGWHFLTGPPPSVEALTRAVGFHYEWVPERQEWAHSAALILCTPDGRVSRYLGGLTYEPETLRLSLVEASQGKVGSLWDTIFLWCYHYDSNEGKYTPIAQNIMRLAGGLIVLVIGLMLVGLWQFEARRRRAESKNKVAGS